MSCHPQRNVILSDVRRQPNKSKDPLTIGISIGGEKFSTTDAETNCDPK